MIQREQPRALAQTRYDKMGIAAKRRKKVGWENIEAWLIETGIAATDRKEA